MTENLEKFLKPKGVVVIGASHEENKLGYGVSRNLISSGYAGEISLVNPKGGELFGYPVYKSLEEGTEKIDLAVIVIPAKYVPQTLIACSQKGVDSAIIVSGGFREAGAEGMALEAKCKEIADEYGIRILGPNCIGIIDTHLPLDTTFIQPPMPAPGEIAFISQSGALGAAMIDWARGEGFGFSQVVSLGNQLDLSEADFLIPISDSANTAVLTMYLESVQDGRAFMENAAIAAEVKPIIGLKVGRSEAGKKAASSHTGALAGTDSAYEAAFRRSGVLRAASTEEMFDWAKMLAWSPGFPSNNRVAILTNAGGPGVTATDMVDAVGLQTAFFTEDTMRKLEEALPAAASWRNPVDMLASASPAVYARCLEILLDDPGVDLALVIAPPPPMFKALDIAKALLPVIDGTSKPVAVSFMGSTLVRDAVEFLRAKKVPEFSFPERAIGAMGALWAYSKLKGRDVKPLTFDVPAEQGDKVGAVLSDLAGYEGFIPPKAAEQIFKAYQMPVLELQFAGSAEAAAAEASKVGYPVVMKIASDELSHKSDLGGVMLNLESEAEVYQAYKELMKQVESADAGDKVYGVYLQPMLSGGQEVIIGAVRDAVFGPMVMFGSGGVEVEGLGDVQFSVAPLTESEIDYLMKNTWAGKKLAGFRHLAPADAASIRDMLIKLGQMMIDHPEIKEVEVNPAIVMEEGKGAFAVDVRILV